MFRFVAVFTWEINLLTKQTISLNHLCECFLYLLSVIGFYFFGKESSFKKEGKYTTNRPLFIG